MKIADHSSLNSLLGSATSLVPDRTGEHAAVRDLRRLGRDCFAALGFDVHDREEWKYANLKPVLAREFKPYLATGAALPAPPVLPVDSGAYRLVFLNGVFDATRSNLTSLPEGLVLQAMAAATDLPGLGELAAFQTAPFMALNTASWGDGLLLELSEGVVLEQPIELHFLTDARAAGCLIAPRNLLHFGRGARATVVEYYTGAVGSAVLNVPVTEIVCAGGAHVRHWKVIREDDRGLHYGSTHVRQETGSSYTSREFSFGGGGVRRELHLDLVGAKAACDLTSLAMADGQQRMDMRTRINHLVSGCTTSELYKGIYAGQARGVFDGLIKVERNAQQTVAHQTNRSLLLSDDAVVASIPRLEIYADDVKCSHGSTTGQLAEEQVFFLRSRGFDASTARTMLAHAFAREIVSGVDSPELGEVLNQEIVQRLAVVEQLEETR